MPLAANVYYQLSERQSEVRPPLVLIHGAGGNHLFWPPQIRRLGGFRVYALDLPGHGRSPGEGYQSIESYSHAVMEWFYQVGLSRAIFIGHSMGSAIALSVALEHKDCVLGLGLVGSAARLRVAPALLDLTTDPANHPQVVAWIVEWAFAANVPPSFKRLAAQRLAETRPAVLRGDFLACDAFDVVTRLGEVMCPALVVCGDEDRLTPLRYAQRLAEGLPQGRLKTLPGVGHMAMLEQPEEVAQALREFCLQIPYL